jgi:O-antigen ligase
MGIEGKQKTSFLFDRGNMQWRTSLFLLALAFPLGLQVFFHQETTVDYRSIVISLQLTSILTGIILLQPLRLAISAKLQILILFWLAWGWLCAVYSPYPSVSALRQVEWTVLVCFTALLVAVFQKYPFIVIWSYGFILTGFFLVSLGIVVYWNLLPDPENYDWVTMMPHFTNIRHFGHYAAAGVILMSIGTVRIQEKVVRFQPPLLFFALLLSVAFGFLFWSGGRGSVLAVAIGLLWIVSFGVQKGQRGQFTLTTIFSASIGWLLSSFFAVQNMSMGLFNSFCRSIWASSLDRLLSGRLSLWKVALEKMNPPEGNLFFGHGPDVFSLQTDFPGISHPHNFFLQALLEWGLPGTVFFSLLLVALYKRCWDQATGNKKTTTELYHYPLLGAQALWVSYFFLGLIDGAFYFALPLTILAVCAAIIFAFSPPPKPQL